MYTYMSTEPIRVGSSSSALDYVLREQIKAIQPKTVVDFGAGGGKIGKIVREIMGNRCTITAVEGYAITVENLKASKVYDNVHYCLLEDFLLDNTNTYDLAIFGDVIEHLTCRSIKKAIYDTLSYFNYFIIVVPLYDIFQDNAYGNIIEKHQSYITDKFFDRYHP
mgnify:CR=1 FL=1